MPRVRTVPARELSGKAREVYDRSSNYGPFSGLVDAMANRPPVLEHMFGLLLDLKAEGVLATRYLELALVTVSKLNACTFCVSSHTPRLTASGISVAAAENILDYKAIPEFDEVDRLVIEYSIAFTNDFHRVRDAMFDRLRKHFDDAQIVELTVVAGRLAQRDRSARLREQRIDAPLGFSRYFICLCVVFAA